jgi:S-adenosylmethionine decarboxylase
VGNEISCVMYGIDRTNLDDNKKLEKILLQALKKDKFTILERVSHQFNPQGYTLVVLLAESHVSISTYPEYGSLFFYLYSCRGKGDGRKTYEWIKERLKPRSVDFKQRPIRVKKI